MHHTIQKKCKELAYIFFNSKHKIPGEKRNDDQGAEWDEDYTQSNRDRDSVCKN